MYDMVEYDKIDVISPINEWTSDNSGHYLYYWTGMRRKRVTD